MNKPTFQQIKATEVMIERNAPKHLIQVVSLEDFLAVLRCAALYRDQLAYARKRISELESNE